ncbi:hypothetical protein MPSEU_000661600 [Mayamaea pseudoterrestris]|nr:hypothetical protein MPSEU_000661600 [Mayamaea pseudoterrestris]
MVPPQQQLQSSYSQDEQEDRVLNRSPRKSKASEAAELPSHHGPTKAASSPVSGFPRQQVVCTSIGGSIIRRRTQQVDFYRNPTILSRLSLNQKYVEAKDRLRRFPNEACIWVAAKRPHQSGYSIRQLPLHICLTNLKRAIDATTCKLLHDLIVSLIVAHPTACKHVDHSNVLPVHAAIWYGASPEVVSMCFMAYPESVHLLDKRGRSCIEILKGSRVESKDRRKMEAVLKLKVDFWKKAQAAAKKRLAAADIPWDCGTATQPIYDTHGPDHSTLFVNEHEEAFDENIGAIEPMAWEQLESRALALEQVLTEVNENNFALTKRIEQLRNTKAELEQKLETQNGELGKQVAAMHDENAKLKARLHEVEMELAEARQKVDAPSRSMRDKGDTSLSTDHGHRSDSSLIINDRGKLHQLITEQLPTLPAPSLNESMSLGDIGSLDLAKKDSFSLNESMSLGDSGSLDLAKKGSFRSPGNRRRGLRSAQSTGGLEDSIAFEELWEVEQNVSPKNGKGYQESSTSLTESSHSLLSTQSFMSSKHYVKVLDDNRKLRKELEEIDRSYSDQRSHLQRLEAYVEELQGGQMEDVPLIDGSKEDDICSASTNSTGLSHVSDGDEHTMVTCSTVAGTKSSANRQNLLATGDDVKSCRDNIYLYRPLAQDIVFIPSSPSLSSDSSDADERHTRVSL